MQARWSPFVKQIVVIGSLAAMIWFLARVHSLLIPVALALLLAYLVSLPVGWLIRQTGWPRTPVVAAFYLLVIVIMITAPVLFVPRLVSLFGSLGNTLRNIVVELSEATPKPIELTPTFTIDLGPFYAPVNQWLTSIAQPDPNGGLGLQTFLFPFASSAVVVVRSAVTSVVWAIFILTISFYVAKDAPVMGRFIASRTPEKLLPEMVRLWHELAAIWDAFVRGQVLLGMTMGVLVWLMTGILGVRNAAALGLLAAVAEFVPGVGPTIAAAVGILIALVLGSNWLPLPHVWFAVIVALAYFSLSQFENLYLLPRIVGRRIALHPVVVVAGALAGAQLGGVLGILLAAPTLASVRVLFGYAVHKLLDEDPFPPCEPVPPREVYWRGLLRDRPIAALLFDLDGTLVQVDHAQMARLANRLAVLRQWIPSFMPEAVARWLLTASDRIVSEIITLLGQLRLRRLLFRLNGRLCRVRAYQTPASFVPVPGSLETLRLLAQRYPLGLVTTRSFYEMASYLARFNLTDVFHVVVTRNDVHLLAPNPAAINLVTKRLGVQPRQCIVIGDSPMDLRAGRSVGALTVAVRTGFARESDLAPADLVIDSVADLLGHLPPSSAEALQEWIRLTSEPVELKE